MKKFNKVYKEKKNKVEKLNEKKTLDDFNKVFRKLLETYNISDFYDLSEKYQNIFLSDLNKYWTEENGLSESGQKFLNRNADMITENSSMLQKKNYLKKKATSVIKETLHSSDIKFKLYDVIDEMFHQSGAKTVSDIASTDVMTSVIHESFSNALNEFMNQFSTEIYESDKEVKKQLKEQRIQNKKKKAKELKESEKHVINKYQKELNEEALKEKINKIITEIYEHDEFHDNMSDSELNKLAKKTLLKEDYDFFINNKKSMKNFL